MKRKVYYILPLFLLLGLMLGACSSDQAAPEGTTEDAVEETQMTGTGTTDTKMTGTDQVDDKTTGTDQAGDKTTGTDQAEGKTTGTDQADDQATGIDQADDIPADYAGGLFDTGLVHKVNVHITEEDWDDLLKNPVDKTKYKVDVEIDGEKVKDVSFSTKGNSSLLFVADDPDSDRYSFKINFGKYTKGQTFHGLDKLSLNNEHMDATYLKDYVSYNMFRKMGIPTPLTSFVWLTVNGQDYGLYTAVEDVSDSFLKRNYGGEGVIYKPESTDPSIALTADSIKDIKENGLKTSGACQGANLVYIDDDPESYPDIFENAETDTDDEDADEVIAALKSLHEEMDLETYLDTDEIIRYFAVQNFLLNYDSYTGSMLHNMVLTKSHGRLSLDPWDYNLAFAAFIPVIGDEVLEDPTDIVNKGIDTPLIGTVEEERPMWRWIVDDEKYKEIYHKYLDQLVADYFESGEFDKELEDVYQMILPYVEKDPTAFYTTDEFKKGYQTFLQFNNKRAKSIRKQLDGKLSPDSEKQSDEDKVDASDLNVKDMGAADL